MKSGKKIIVAIISVLILLLMVGCAFAYMYIATDIFRTDKEMFFTYLAQITTEENGFLDNRINSYFEKKTQTAYENSGEITAKVELPEEMKEEMPSIEDILGNVNDLAIRFSGKVDSVNQKVEQNIEVDYGNNVILPINYRQDGNAIGLQTNELSKKFIAVRNENLKQLATNLGIEDISEVPDKIELPEEVENISFTDAEIEQLKQIYMPVLQENLLEENFSSIKTERDESFTLELSNEQIKNIIVKLLEATKQNTLIIDKVNEVMLEQNPEAEKMDITVIDDIIQGINEEDISDITNLKLTLIQSNKLLNQITIQLGENIITIEKRDTTESLNYNINCHFKETKTNEIIEQSSTSSLFEEETSEPEQYNIYFNVIYNGLDSLSNVNENYEFGFNITADQDVMKYEYQITTNTQFNENLVIDPLDKSVAIFLNDYEETQLTPFLTQVGTRLLAINKNQMEELGLKEYENPILYSNPITILGLTVYNMASETITNTDLSEMEVSTFNERFTLYVGESKSGSEVNAMIKTVQNSSLSSAGSEAHFIKVTLDGAEASENVDSTKTYKIEAVYDTEGYINEMKVTTNN